MEYKMLVVTGCLVACLTTGCATITRGSNDTLVVESDPAGADVKLSTGMTGKTPATFKLPRKEALVVEIQKAGYESVQVNVTPQIAGGGSAAMAGNVLLGGLIGVAVDAGSGAMNDLKPNPISVKLVALDGVDAAAEDRLKSLRALRRSGAITESEYREKRGAILDRL